MTERAKIQTPDIEGPLKLNGPVFFSTGSTLLNKVIGGGWALGRIFNLVGDRSTGKTLVAIESFANFERTFTAGCMMRYAEAESAFDDIFAEQLGFPKSVERPTQLLLTVEDFRDDFDAFVERCAKAKVPGLYILDSLDALSDDAEVAAFEKGEKKEDGSDKGSYGTGKAKKLTQMFRLLVKKAGRNNVTLGIISQIRDRIGVTFGETKMLTGGHALDFYASQIVWLAETSKIKRQALGMERMVGIELEAYCKKCKVGYPFRRAPLDLMFGYGLDDEISMLKWLKTLGSLGKTTDENNKQFEVVKKQIEVARKNQSYAELDMLQTQLQVETIRIWDEIDTRLAPTIRKYRPVPPPPQPAAVKKEEKK